MIMLRPRIIPCLLVHNRGLVKTVAFKDPKYVGDPINAVKIFNEKQADELAVFDIDASARNAEPDFKMVANLAAECRMPLCYGGGVKTVAQARRIIGLGVEKIAISSAAASAGGCSARLAHTRLARRRAFRRDRGRVGWRCDSGGAVVRCGVHRGCLGRGCRARSGSGARATS